MEDHLAIARQVLDFLDGLGWQTDHAGTGALAVQLATCNRYDVVLLDLNLPDMDGLQVCRAIKAAAPSNVPILMLTARDSYGDKARGFRDGVDDYLPKPFDLREVTLRCEALARRLVLPLQRLPGKRASWRPAAPSISASDTVPTRSVSWRAAWKPPLPNCRRCCSANRHSPATSAMNCAGR